jgi:hypothetical protein
LEKKNQKKKISTSIQFTINKFVYHTNIILNVKNGKSSVIKTIDGL